MIVHVGRSIYVCLHTCSKNHDFDKKKIMYVTVEYVLHTDRQWWKNKMFNGVMRRYK